MIVKNEADNLADCLAGVKDVVDEMIVVDTGSTDGTQGIARRLGAKVFETPWPDSFSAARNESLKHATGDWAFWLDADDRVDPINAAKLKAVLDLLATTTDTAFVMKCRCVPSRPGEAATVVDHVRLFRLDPRIRWTYRVHEQILPAVRAVGGTVRFTDVMIDHVGYVDPALRRRKLERDLRLLGLDNAERPHEPFTLFNLGQVYQELGRVEESLPFLAESLERSAPTDSIVRKLYALLAQGCRKLGRPADAIHWCGKGRAHYPQDVELLFVEGLARRETGDLEGAATCLRQLLQVRESGHFASVDAGIAGYKARHNLAVVCRELGRPDEAEEHWRAALKQEPNFRPARDGLDELNRQRDVRHAIDQPAGPG